MSQEGNSDKKGKSTARKLLIYGLAFVGLLALLPILLLILIVIASFLGGLFSALLA